MSVQSPQTSSVPAKARKRIFIVEDHPVFRRGLTHLIESDPEFGVCGHAASFSEALDQLRRVEADAVILDVAIEGANGLELVKHLRTEHPHLALLVLSVHDELIYGPRALRAGANGYLMKRESDDLLLQAVRQVLSGKVFVSPALNRELIHRVTSQGEPGKSRLEALSDRELEVLALVGQGLSSIDIAENLHISVKTVETHRLHVKEKLGIGHASELVRFATQWVEGQTGV